MPNISKKGPVMKAMDSKFFFSETRKHKKVPEAYETLNPALRSVEGVDVCVSIKSCSM